MRWSSMKGSACGGATLMLTLFFSGTASRPTTQATFTWMDTTGYGQLLCWAFVHILGMGYALTVQQWRGSYSHKAFPGSC